ncbi:hypothetical protein ZIOFF_062186 [Zingiber officinale]|uniref:Uncharacterized protein n=1 Tax=Zingiber officinale TaxID=94328 RepID=A0A8J5F525_ZINOF|nr:hypothetical protein ZIOFF_062186 [Zingiber officinale]
MVISAIGSEDCDKVHYIVAMEVTEVLQQWPEMNNRERKWLHVPGCMQLSADGVVRILKWHYELKGRLKILK